MWPELQFAKFQNILIPASWFHVWTPALELQTKNAIENVLISKDQHWRSPAKKLEEERETR